MEPPKGFASNLWSLWTNGHKHKVQLWEAVDIAPFLSELGKQARKRYRRLGLAYVHSEAWTPPCGIAFQVHVVPTKETQN